MSSEVQHIVRSGDALVRVTDLKWAEPSDFKDKPIVILVHGFTSHGAYLQELGSFIESFGYQVFIFNYNSFRGIARAADSLKDFLLRYDNQLEGAISRSRLFLVAHSMGGLVARRLALDADGGRIVRGIVMLGTPNGGCLGSARWLSYFIQYGEHISGFMPEASSPACLSAKECIKSDTDSDRPFIDRLNEMWEESLDCPPAYSISGGRRFLSLSRNGLRNWLANHAIQTEIGNEENDGLVTEKSVNLHSAIAITAAHRYAHFNTYPYYHELNHTNLTQNQTLALEIVDWFGRIQPPT